MADRGPLHFKEHVCGGTHITVQLLPLFSSPLLITSTLSRSFYFSLSLVTALAKRPFSGQAEPSQSVNWGAETCVKHKSTCPCLLAIPAFARIAGVYQRHLNSNRGIWYR